MNARRISGAAPIQDSKPATEDVGGRESVLELWPIGRQVIGLPNFGDWLTLLKDTVSSCWEPIQRDELVEILREDKGYSQSPANLRSMLRLAKHLGLVREEDGLYRTEEDPAEELLQTEDFDALVEAFLVRVYGFGHLLRMAEAGLESAGDAVGVLVARFGLQRPQSYALIARSKEVGLLELARSGQLTLSPSGKKWAARLPETLPVREAKTVVVKTSPA